MTTENVARLRKLRDELATHAEHSASRVHGGRVTDEGVTLDAPDAICILPLAPTLTLLSALPALLAAVEERDRLVKAIDEWKAMYRGVSWAELNSEERLATLRAIALKDD